MARRSLIEWISRCDKSTVSLGVSGGYIGYAYLCYSMFKDEKWYKKWKSMIDDQFSKRAYQLLLQYEYYNDHRFLDALNGVVCIVHYLIQTGYMEKDFYSTIYNSLLNRICKIINETDSNIDLGIAHGILGLLAVAYECEVLLNYHHDSSVRIAEKYYKLFDNDSIEFPEYVCLKNKKKPEYKKSKKFGWCYGSLETLNILYTIFKETNKVEEMINSGVHGVFTLSTELMYANFIFEFYDLLNNEKTNIGTEKIDHIDKIELKNVSYEYTSGKSVLKNINCEFSAGNNYAIIEKNGSGKSTLIKLLSGLYDDYSGQILINGIDLKKIDIESYFQTISVQYQDFNNYEMNVEKNILIGNINDNTKDEINLMK